MSLKVFILIVTVTVIQVYSYNPNRLPKDVYPIQYDISINTEKSFGDTYFIGQVDITLNVRAETSELTLNQLDLDFTTCKLYEVENADQIEIPVQWELENGFEQMVISMENKLTVFEVGKTYQLSIAYTGWINNIGAGLYIKRGTADDGTRISLLATNFVPISARQAFPCYDEPEFKAIYKLSLVHESKYSAISNMPIETQVIDNDLTTTTFHSTPPLSPHSLGFVISDFESSIVDKNVKFVAYHDKKHTKEEVNLVLESNEKILNRLETYLNTELGLTEMKDVPQFEYYYTKIGNLGLLVNEMRYYYCNSSSTRFQQDQVIRHVSRLMANQFFGNLITPEWWDDAWFTHGLSIVLEYYILETEYPELKSKDRLMVNLYNNFFESIVVFREVDMVEMTRFLITEPYEWKSAEMIFMLQNILTDDIFRLALQTLLAEYRNAPVSTKLFFDVLTRVAHENSVLSITHDLNTIMDTWITADGSPVLEVTRNYETGIVTLKQGNILTYLNYGFETIPPNPIWWLPYNYILENDTPAWDTFPHGWMENVTTKDIDLNFKLADDEWILFNVKQTGFYHTIYDRKNWLLLAKQLTNDHEKIHYSNRGHLVSDAFKFGYLNFTTLDVAFEMANYLNNETSPFPFQILFTDEFILLDQNLYATDVYANFTKFMRNKLENMYDRVRVSKEVSTVEYDELSLRAALTQMACRMHLDACLIDARNVFLQYYKNIKQINTDFESDLGHTLITYGFIMVDQAVFWDVILMVNDGSDDSLAYEYAEIIGMTQDTTYSDMLISILTSDNGYKFNDVTINIAQDVRLTIFKSLIENNQYVLDIIFLYLKDMYPRIMEIYGYNAPYIVKLLASRTTTDERFEKLLLITKMYAIEYFEEFEQDLEYANRTLQWNAARIGEFQSVLAELLDGRVIEEEDPEVPDEGEDDDDSATSVSLCTVTLLLTSLISVYIK